MTRMRIGALVRKNADYLVVTRKLDALAIPYELCPPLGVPAMG